MISRRRGRQPSRRGRLAYTFARFSENLHEIQKIWSLEGGARALGAPPGSATELSAGRNFFFRTLEFVMGH